MQYSERYDGMALILQQQLAPGSLINSTVSAACVNWLMVGCVDDRIGMDFCDVVSDDFKWHGDHFLSLNL